MATPSWMSKGADAASRAFNRLAAESGAPFTGAGFELPTGESLSRIMGAGLTPGTSSTQRLYQGTGVSGTNAPMGASDFGSKTQEFASRLYLDNDFLKAFGDTALPGANASGGVGGGPSGNAAIDSVAQMKGLPPSVLAAMVNRESSQNWDANNRIAYLRGERMLPYVGIFESTARSWGLDFEGMIGNQQAQLAGMATILNGIKQQQGFSDWEDVAAYYFAGPNWNNPDWGDELGMTVGQYRQSFSGDVARFGGSSNVQAGPGSPYNAGAANAIVQEALQYVGVSYVWGSIPGAGQDPWDTGWDCSGLTKWLSDKYGDGSLPAGSHYQYQWGLDTGQIFTDTNQLRPGDLVYFNTGWQGGAGSNLNAAGHVGVYIGNGKMLHAANPSQGTIVSDFNAYASGGYQYLGAMHMPWSGGAAGVPGSPAGSPAGSTGGGVGSPGYNYGDTGGWARSILRGWS